MSGAAFLHLCGLAGMGLLTLAMVLALIRLARGPTLADRILALDLMSTLAIAFLAAFSAANGEPFYLDVGVSLCLLGFVATTALVRFLLKTRKIAQRTTR